MNQKIKGKKFQKEDRRDESNITQTIIGDQK